MPSHEELKRRAHAAWLTHGPGGPEPVWSATTVETIQGRTYVMLRRGGEVIATYRYKPATAGFRDTLKYLRRMPRHYPDRVGYAA